MKNEHIYLKRGSHQHNIIFLHGYDQTKEMMFPLLKRVESFANVMAIDLPGNKNYPLLKAYTIDDYIDYLKDVIKRANFTPSIIVAHSFGGKLATYYAISNEVTLLLLAPSSFKPPFSLKTKYKIVMYKIYKWLLNHKLVIKIPSRFLGSSDYQNARGVKKDTFLNIVNSYLSKNELKKIKGATYLIYGNNDTEVTYYQMKKMKKYISNCALITIPGDHYAYLYNASAITSLIKEIIKEMSK